LPKKNYDDQQAFNFQNLDSLVKLCSSKSSSNDKIVLTGKVVHEAVIFMFDD